MQYSIGEVFANFKYVMVESQRHIKWSVGFILKAADINIFFWKKIYLKWVLKSSLAEVELQFLGSFDSLAFTSQIVGTIGKDYHDWQ